MQKEGTPPLPLHVAPAVALALASSVQQCDGCQAVSHALLLALRRGYSLHLPPPELRLQLPAVAQLCARSLQHKWTRLDGTCHAVTIVGKAVKLHRSRGSEHVQGSCSRCPLLARLAKQVRHLWHTPDGDP